MKKTFKTEILNFVHSLGIPVAGISGDGATYSRVVCLFPYYTGEKMRGNLSMYTYGPDYHRVAKKYLLRIAEYMEALAPDTKTRIHVDIGEPDDKSTAYNAGLGFYGKNTLLIHETYGSFVFIGYVETSLVLPPDTPSQKSCIGCLKCEAACPGGALKNGKIDTERCASAISQKKGALTEKEAAILKKSGYVWGCDICQTVCPHNAAVSASPLPDFYENLLFSLSSVPETNKAFLSAFADRAFSWRGKEVIKRNLEILSSHEMEEDGHTM